MWARAVVFQTLAVFGCRMESTMDELGVDVEHLQPPSPPAVHATVLASATSFLRSLQAHGSVQQHFFLSQSTLGSTTCPASTLAMNRLNDGKISETLLRLRNSPRVM